MAGNPAMHVPAKMFHSKFFQSISPTAHCLQSSPFNNCLASKIAKMEKKKPARLEGRPSVLQTSSELFRISAMRTRRLAPVLGADREATEPGRGFRAGNPARASDQWPPSAE